MKKIKDVEGKITVISLVLVFALILSSLPVYAQSLSEAENKKKEIQSSLNEARGTVNSLKKSKDKTQENIELIDKEISGLESENEKFNNEIQSINHDIEELNISIDNTTSEVEKWQQDMSKRIVFSYENGRHKIINALFSSKDIGEFISVVQYTIEMAKYDKEVMDEYEKSVQVLSEQTNALAQKQEDAKRLEKENEDRIDAIAKLKEEKEEELSDLNGELADASLIASEYEKEMQAQDEVLSALSAAIAAQKQREAAAQAAQATVQTTTSVATQGSTVSTSGFTWPCPAMTRISSEFGVRESPTAGASTNHKGIDIAAPKGSPILAAAAGEVILSTYSQSAGNYIIIDHGINSSGKSIYSVYMHANTRDVSLGQKVEKGQRIATVGSTGYSTGPHLHFGISENGVYVNPWNYVKKP